MNLRHVILYGLAIVAAFSAASVAAAGEESPRGERQGLDVAPVTNKRYGQECGSCHFAYQPGLLPARSWESLMRGLQDHFGDNAELALQDRQAITRYLVENAADRSAYRRSQKIARSAAGARIPVRITDTPYVSDKHRELPARLVRDDDRVKSLSNCVACHTRAARGSYREREINIPGYGRWDD